MAKQTREQQLNARIPESRLDEVEREKAGWENWQVECHDYVSNKLKSGFCKLEMWWDDDSGWSVRVSMSGGGWKVWRSSHGLGPGLKAPTDAALALEKVVNELGDKAFVLFDVNSKELMK